MAGLLSSFRPPGGLLGGFGQRLHTGVADNAGMLGAIGMGLLGYRQNATQPMFGDPRTMMLAQDADRQRMERREDRDKEDKQENFTASFLKRRLPGISDEEALGIATNPTLLSGVLKGEIYPDPVSASDDTTAAIRNFQFLQSLPPDQREAFSSMSGDGMDININNGGGVGPGDEKLYESLGSAEGKRWSDLLAQGDKARGVVQNLQVMDELAKTAPQGPLVGRAAEMFPGVSSAGDAFNKLAQATAPLLRVPGSGSQSDIEYEGFMNSLPRLRNHPDANRLVSQVYQAKAAIDAERADIIYAVQSEEISPAQARRRLAALEKRSILTPDVKSALGLLSPGFGGGGGFIDKYGLER